jgi:hypothetical protein
MSYMSKGSWQTGWTSRTAHLVVGYSSNHGNARYSLVKGQCGRNFNPGHMVDPQNLTEWDISHGVEVCQACLSGQVGKSVASKSAKEFKKCIDADCDGGRAPASSDYCSVCRPYHQ